MNGSRRVDGSRGTEPERPAVSEPRRALSQSMFHGCYGRVNGLVFGVEQAGTQPGKRAFRAKPTSMESALRNQFQPVGRRCSERAVARTLSVLFLRLRLITIQVRWAPTAAVRRRRVTFSSVRPTRR